jgi:hypothetical protein
MDCFKERPKPRFRSLDKKKVSFFEHLDDLDRPDSLHKTKITIIDLDLIITENL